VLRSLLTLVVVLLLTPPLALAAMVISLLRPESDASVHIGRFWAWVLLGAMKVRTEYRGIDRPPPPSPYVFIANHQSLVDILAVVPALPTRIRFVAKRELFRIPIFGWALRAGGYVPIDRGRRQQAIRSLDEAGRRIRAGRPFVLFAEGTRSRDGRMGPFKKGAFHVALQTGATVVPVAISGSWHILRPKSLRVRPGTVRVTLGKPIDVGPYLPGDVEGLSREVRRVIAAGLRPGELREEDRGGTAVRSAGVSAAAPPPPDGPPASSAD